MWEMQDTQVWSLGWEDPQSRKWQPTLVFLPGKFHEQRSLAGYSPWGCKVLDTTKQLSVHTWMIYIISPHWWIWSLFLMLHCYKQYWYEQSWAQRSFLKFKSIGMHELVNEGVKLLSHVWFLATPWTVAYQVLLSMGFSRQEYWSGVPLPSPFPTQRLNPCLLRCRQTLYHLSHQGSLPL